MSKAVQAIVGVVEIAAGVALSEYGIGEALIAAGVSQLLGYAISLLNNPRRSPLIPIGASYAGTLDRPAVAPETTEQILTIYLGE